MTEKEKLTRMTRLFTIALNLKWLGRATGSAWGKRLRSMAIRIAEGDSPIPVTTGEVDELCREAEGAVRCAIADWNSDKKARS